MIKTVWKQKWFIEKPPHALHVFFSSVNDFPNCFDHPLTVCNCRKS